MLTFSPHTQLDGRVATRSRIRTFAVGALVALLGATALIAGPLSPAAHAADFDHSWGSAIDLASAVDTVTTHFCGSGANTHTFMVQRDEVSSEPVVWDCDDDVTFLGYGSQYTFSPDAQGHRFLEVTSDADVTVDNLVIDGFAVTDTANANESGAAISHTANGTVTVRDSVISNNAVTGPTGASTATISGAGVFSRYGGVTVVDSTFLSNSLVAWDARGGAIRTFTGDIAVSGSTFTGNSVTSDYADGGAIFTDSGTVSITGSSLFDGNWVLDDNTTASGGPRGGAITATTSASLTIMDSTFTDNWVRSASAGPGGGAVYVDDVPSTITDSTFTGNQAISDGSAAPSGGALRFGAGMVEISGSTFTDNAVDGSDGSPAGGAIVKHGGHLTVSGSELTGNSVTGEWPAGGAISGGPTNVDVSTSIFRGNVADGTQGAYGGAIATWEGVIVSTASTFDSNTADGSDYAEGGAISTVDGNVISQFSTFAGNQAIATVEALGGAIGSWNTASTTWTTFTGNSASGGTGDHVFVETAYSPLASAFGATPGDACVLGDIGTSGGDNWATDGTCWDSSTTGDVANGTDAKLLPLADNGGPTPTALPAWDSPLVDAAAAGSCFSYDQRLLARPLGDGCDIGAVELGQATFSYVTDAGTVNATVYNASNPGTPVWTPTSDFPATPPADISFPFGMVGFSVDTPVDGATVTVVLDLPSPANTLYKYVGSSWLEHTGAEFAGTSVAYDVTDGGTFDNSGVDGTIDDPVAPGIGASFTG